jgi:hypothetical protein
MPKAQPSAEQHIAELNTEAVDQKLETLESEPLIVEAPTTNGAEVEEEAEEPPATATEEAIAEHETAAKAVEEETKVQEEPAEPAPTPVATDLQASAKPAASSQSTGPPKPLTWASRAAAAAGTSKPAVPAVAAPKSSTPPAAVRATPAAKPAAAQATPAAAAAATTATDKNKENVQPDGWQTAGSDHAKRQNRPQSVSGPPEKEGTMGYVRNVTEKVSAEELRAVLTSYGPLIYFDVNRSKVMKHHLLGLSNLILL